MTAAAAIIAAIIAAVFIVPPTVNVTISEPLPGASSPAPYPPGTAWELGSPGPIPVTAPGHAAHHQTPAPAAPSRQSPARKRTEHVPQRLRQTERLPAPPVLTITLLTTPGLLGSLIAPVQLEWAASVTESGRAITQGCTISWSLYSDGTSTGLGTTGCDGTFTLNSLYLGEGTFALDGDTVLASGSTAKASADLSVGG